MKPSDDDLDELLGGGYLPGPQYDAIGRRVFQRLESRPRLWAQRIGVCCGLGAAAVAVALFVLPAQSDHFRAKGLESAASGGIYVGCAGPETHRCRAGDTLMFSVSAGVSPGYLVAHAERVDDPKTRIWYYPSASGEAPRVVAPEGATSVLPVGIRLGPEHGPGRYRIQAFIAQGPLLRSEIDRGGTALSNHSTTEVEIVR